MVFLNAMGNLLRLIDVEGGDRPEQVIAPVFREKLRKPLINPL